MSYLYNSIVRMRTVESKAELLSLLDEAASRHARLTIKLKNDPGSFTGTIQFVKDGSLEKISLELDELHYKTIKVKEIESVVSNIPLLDNGDTSYLIRSRFTA